MLTKAVLNMWSFQLPMSKTCNPAYTYRKLYE